MHGGVAAELGGTGNTFGSANSQPAPRALTCTDLAHMNSTWISHGIKVLGMTCE